MHYYFPSIIPGLSIPKEKISVAFHTVNSGENGIRLLLRNLPLPPKAKVGLPLFVCDSLKEAVLKEGLSPFYLDLKSDGTYWSDYTSALNAKEVKAIILVHLYGFIHPDTNLIMNEAKLKGIPLIHDAAQSYGIDESKLSHSSGIIYSFGPGKSSTAAGGAILKNISDNFYKANCKQTKSLLRRKMAELFLKSRIYGYRFSRTDKIIYKILNKMSLKEEISDMSDFQKSTAQYAMQLTDKLKSVRQKNYLSLKKAIESNKELALVFDDDKGLYFKMIFKAKKNIDKLKYYLEKNQVPYFCLRNSLFIDGELFSAFPEFSENAYRFIEISTEASIPDDEMERVASILETYADN